MHFVGKNIKRIRTSLNISQSEVASALECSQQSINSIEKGRTFGIIIIKYMRFLKQKGISIDSLFEDRP